MSAMEKTSVTGYASLISRCDSLMEDMKKQVFNHKSKDTATLKSTMISSVEIYVNVYNWLNDFKKNIALGEEKHSEVPVSENKNIQTDLGQKIVCSSKCVQTKMTVCHTGTQTHTVSNVPAQKPKKVSRLRRFYNRFVGLFCCFRRQQLDE